MKKFIPLTSPRYFSVVRFMKKVDEDTIANFSITMEHQQMSRIESGAVLGQSCQLGYLRRRNGKAEMFRLFDIRKETLPPLIQFLPAVLWSETHKSSAKLQKYLATHGKLPEKLIN